MPGNDETQPNERSVPDPRFTQGTRVLKPAQNNELEIQSESIVLAQRLLHRWTLIDQGIQKYLSRKKGEPEILYDAAQHLIKAGGKRFRSLITLLCCEAVGGDIEKVLPISIAAELLQTASLIHDDIIDQDEIRRGVETVHKKYGENIAIIAGDLLIAQAFQIIGEHGTPEILANMGAGGIRMCEGEASDLFMSTDQQETFTKAHYLSMIGRKTVAFMEEAAKIGAIAGNATEKQREALSKYGAMLGLAFQLRDDIIDVEIPRGRVKKTIRSDLRLKRGNYPLIHALEASTADERSHCLHALNEGDIEPTLQLIEKTKAIQQTYAQAEGYVEKAKEALQGVEFQNTDLLEQVAHFALQRNY